MNLLCFIAFNLTRNNLTTDINAYNMLILIIVLKVNNIKTIII